MMNDITEQIADLQARVTFQEDTISKLSDHIAVQDKELIEAQRQIAMLREKLLDIMTEVDQLGPLKAQERPPHY